MTRRKLLSATIWDKRRMIFCQLSSRRLSVSFSLSYFLPARFDDRHDIFKCRQDARLASPR